MKRASYFIIFLLTTGIFFSSCNKEKYELRFQPIVGKTYELMQDTRQSISQTINGKVEEVNNQTLMVLSYYIKNKIDNNTIIDVTIKRVKYEMKSEKINMTFDSEVRPIPEDNMIAQVFTALVGKTLTITVAETGEVIKVEGSSVIFNAILNELHIPNPAMKKQLEQTLNQVIGEKAFKGNMGMITYIFPDKKVAIGDSWKNETRLEQLVPTLVSNKWQLSSITEDHAIVKGTSEITTLSSEPLAQMGQMPMKYNLEGSQDALVEIDRFSGWIITAEINNVISGTIEIEPNSNAPQGMTIPLEFSTHTKYETIK